ncbi:MAG TPA: sugar phosphate nucleotidyltransferase [Nitrospiraceae bacterium]|nr:sugar phosphate nucleotidyltransferase [Nitrospiraceae bacterium]
MKNGDVRGSLWSIVLAGGDGVRTKEFIGRWLGYEKPKQYCTFVGTRSMFQHTLDRAAGLTPWERVVVVAARHHQREVWDQLDARPASMVLFQPKNVDTAAGVFLPLTYILARDPLATVVIYPSDHFISPEGSFLSVVDQAVQGSNSLGGRPVLLAARPDSLDLEYGWIKPGRLLDQTGTAAIHAVEAFIEKPDEDTAREARAVGSLWNTLVFAAKGQELWSVGWKCFPDMMSRFERLNMAIDTAEELRVLDAIYEAMPHRNFSSHLLQCAPERLAVMEMTGVFWSDWGNPERILSGLEKFGRRPAMAEDPRPFLYVG